jgi:hypothetical protein
VEQIDQIYGQRFSGTTIANQSHAATSAASVA